MISQLPCSTNKRDERARLQLQRLKKFDDTVSEDSEFYRHAQKHKQPEHLSSSDEEDGSVCNSDCVTCEELREQQRRKK